ncbi:Uncharacterized protein APZ42_027943 [Daphnia magna]|uniref:RNA-directed DNA polymerase n=1 Tax=Daphnia magna TaxID=35525 RepID=A0A164QXS1_9CRUS|nr:Uncharacterized protein APZ42_027943 [Daphnia magna]
MKTPSNRKVSFTPGLPLYGAVASKPSPVQPGTFFETYEKELTRIIEAGIDMKTVISPARTLTQAEQNQPTATTEIPPGTTNPKPRSALQGVIPLPIPQWCYNTPHINPFASSGQPSQSGKIKATEPQVGPLSGYPKPQQIVQSVSKSPTTPRIRLQIGNGSFNALVDSGAGKSLINSALFNKLRQQNDNLPHSREVAVDLFDISNRPLICNGTVVVNVLVEDERPHEPFQQEFIVVQGIMEQCVLGLDTLYQHDFVFFLFQSDISCCFLKDSRLPPGLQVDPYVSTKPNERFFQIALINETSHTIILPRHNTLGHVSFKPRTRVAACSNQPSNLPPDILEASFPNVTENVKYGLHNLLLANQHVSAFKTNHVGHTGLVIHIEMKESLKEKTAFIVENNLYEWSYLAFGLTDAPGTFQRLMNFVLQEEIGKTCLVYLDDIIIFSNTNEHHVKNLNRIFELLDRANLRGFSTIAHPLLCQTKAKPNDKVAWGAPEEEAFEFLSKCLTLEPILAYPDFSKEFLIYTDASDCGSSAVLSQMHDGKDKPIAYASRHLNKAEVKTSPLSSLVTTGYKPSRTKLGDYGDGLSCWPTLGIPSYRPSRVNENTDFLARILVQSVQVTPKADDTMFREQQKDPLCCNIKDYVENGTLSEENSTQIWAKKIAYQSTILRLRDKYYWPTMLSDVKEYCLACKPCALQQGSNLRVFLNPLDITSKPFELLGLDFLGPIQPHSLQGNNDVLVITDYFTKWVEVIALQDQTALTTSQVLMDKAILYHGPPKAIVTDRGSNFTSELFSSL